MWSFCSAFLIFLNKNFIVFGYKVVKHLMSWPLNELVKLTMLWTSGPWCLKVNFLGSENLHWDIRSLRCTSTLRYQELTVFVSYLFIFSRWSRSVWWTIRLPSCSSEYFWGKCSPNWSSTSCCEIVRVIITLCPLLWIILIKHAYRSNGKLQWITCILQQITARTSTSVTSFW